MRLAVTVCRHILRNRSFSSLTNFPLVSLDRPDIWYPPQSPSRVSPHRRPHYNDHQTTVEIDGKLIANDIKSTLATEVNHMKSSINKTPGLGIILVGKRKDSESFIRIKKKACKEVGITSEVHLNEQKIINSVNVEKDVDGFHPVNIGNLAMSAREPLFIPCASKRCFEVLHRYDVEIIGKKVVVIGRSKITGLPTSLLLQRHHATVSVIHSFTKNPEEITRKADILVSDVGVPNLVRGDWLKPGVVVIDMGSTLVTDSNGSRVTGDVCYEEAIQKASLITPVPGGVGPVNISMLLYNTVEAAKRAYQWIKK